MENVKSNFIKKIKISLLIFTLVGTVAVIFLPYVTSTLSSGNAPGLIQFAITAIFLIVATAFLLWYAAKTIGLGKGWFLLALTYNSLIIIIKFILSPLSLYQQGTIQLSMGGFNPNDLGSIMFSAVLILALYAGVFAIINLVYKKILEARLRDRELPDAPKKKHYISFVSKILLIIAIIVAGAITKWLFIPLMLVLFFSMPALSYLQYVFSGVGIILIIAIFATIYAAIGAFDRATYTAVEVRDGAVLAGFFLLGLSLLVIYHFLWVIYMGTLISIWPFKVILPSEGK